MKKNDSENTDHTSQKTIESLREELRIVHDELNRTNSELMQLTVDLEEGIRRTIEWARANPWYLR